MFKFFNKKEEPKNRPPHSTTSNTADDVKKEEEESAAGGFFNLPPVAVGAAKSGPTNPAQKHFSPPPVPSQVATPNHGSRAPYPGTAPGNSLFDNMAIKNPATTTQDVVPTQPSMFANLKTHEPPAVSAAAPSLFANLEMASSFTPASSGSPYANNSSSERSSVPAASTSNEPRLLPRRSSGPKTTQSTPTAISTSNASRHRSTPNIPNNLATKPIKKKKKTTTIGIYSNLTPDQAVALQRGDAEVVETLKRQPSSSEEGSIREFAVHAHGSESRESSGAETSSLSGSILSGLVIHQQQAPVHETVAVPTSGSGNKTGTSILDGLTLHHSPQASTYGYEDSSPLSDSAAQDATPDVESPVHVDSPTTSPLQPVVRKKSFQKKQNTPEEKLQQTLLDFELSASQFRRNIESLTAEENKLITRRDQLEQQLAGYKTDLSRVELLQEKASEEEDFDRAEQLNSNINTIKHCITLAESDLRRVESEVDSTSLAKEKAFAQQLTQTKGTLLELESFREDQEKCRIDCKQKAADYETEERQRLKFEDERIQAELHHVEVNLEHLDDEKKQIENSIAEQCKDEMAVKMKLTEEKEVIEREVEMLKAQLDAKLLEMSNVSKELDKVDRDISVVRKKFARQIHRLDVREEGIQKTKREIEADMSVLESQKHVFEEKMAAFSSEMEDYNQRILAVKKELQTAQQLSETLKMRDDRRKVSSAGKKEKAAQLAQLREAACLAEQQYRVISKQQAEIQARIVDYHATITSVDTCLPRLEQDKKLAASQRNFKEAGRISKEIKKLEAEREKAVNDLAEAQSELDELESVSRARLATQTEKESKLKAVEREIDLKLLQELWEDAMHLRRGIKKIKARKTVSKSANLSPREGPDFEAAAIILLSAELEACSADAEELQKKYGLPAPEITDEEEDNEEEEKKQIASENYRRKESVRLENISAEDLRKNVHDLEKKIEEATDVEDYELAAQLDEELHLVKDQIALIESGAGNDSVSQLKKEPIDSETKEVGEEEEESKVSVQELEDKLQQLEIQLDEATEREEYDLADSLDDDIQALRAQLERLGVATEAAPRCEEYLDDEDDEDEQAEDDDQENQDQWHEAEEVESSTLPASRTSERPIISNCSEEGKGDKNDNVPSTAESEPGQLFMGLAIVAPQDNVSPDEINDTQPGTGEPQPTDEIPNAATTSSCYDHSEGENDESLNAEEEEVNVEALEKADAEKSGVDVDEKCDVPPSENEAADSLADTNTIANVETIEDSQKNTETSGSSLFAGMVLKD